MHNQYLDFKALAQGKVDYMVDVIPVRGSSLEDVMMCVCAEEGAIYITKDQAKEFFGLVDPEMFADAMLKEREKKEGE